MSRAHRTAPGGKTALGAARRGWAIAVAILVATAMAGAGSAWAAAATVRVEDEGYLRLAHSSGALLTDEGSVHGTIPGKVRIRFVYDGDPSVNAQITIIGHAGSILAQGNGRLSSSNGPSPSFKGTLTIKGGSGRYAGAHGSGAFYGVFYRSSYAMTVQAEGVLRY